MKLFPSCRTATVLGRSAAWLISALVILRCSVSAAEPPKVGEPARDFAAETLGGKQVHLKELTAEGPVALIVLRGWPGYQCPACDRQVREFTAAAAAAEFAALGTRVMFLYPGPAEGGSAERRVQPRERSVL